MRKIYQLDANSIFTGTYRTIGDKDGRPIGWIETTIDPPDGIVLWRGEWVILEQYPTPPQPVPQSITMRQARLILLNLNLLDQVDATLAAIPDETERKAAQIEWEYAATVDRSSILVQTLASTLGLTEEDLDNLYIQASQL